MELSQIRYFVLTAQLENMSQAARALNISQPTLSKSISNLENELGVQLFDRSGKKLILNQRGKLFLDGALNGIEEIQEAAEAAANHAMHPRLQIGLYHSGDRFLLCLGEFIKNNPHVKLSLIKLNMEAGNINTDDFDMLLYPRGNMFKKYKGELLYTEGYYLAVHKNDPLAGMEAAGLEDIPRERLVFLRHDKNNYDLPFHLMGRDKNCSFTNSLDTQRILISQGFARGFVPESGASGYKNDPGIVLVPIRDEALCQEIMAGFKREKHLSPIGKEFSQFVKNYFIK